MTYRVPHCHRYRSKELHMLWDSTRHHVPSLSVLETLDAHVWSVETGQLVVACVLHLPRVIGKVFKSWVLDPTAWV